MKQKIYQIDAFTDHVFGGNPAAICILEQWLDDLLLQKIAQENNLAETAFLVKNDTHLEIRWFTPQTEVALCGHATLASAYVLFNYHNHKENTIRFYSHKSGNLIVTIGENGLLTLDFPSDTITPIKANETLEKALGLKAAKAFKGKTDYLLIYSSQSEIEALNPNFHLLSQCDCRGVIVSAPGDTADFVSRFFAPKCGISEDSVTGSAHTTMAPYWSKVLGKNKLTAKQLSKRGGNLWIEFLGERVNISGKAVPYLIGEINI